MSYFSTFVPCLTLQIGGCRWLQPVDEIDRPAPREGNSVLNAIERFPEKTGEAAGQLQHQRGKNGRCKHDVWYPHLVIEDTVLAVLKVAGRHNDWFRKPSSAERTELDEVRQSIAAKVAAKDRYMAEFEHDAAAVPHIRRLKAEIADLEECAKILDAPARLAALFEPGEIDCAGSRSAIVQSLSQDGSCRGATTPIYSPFNPCRPAPSVSNGHSGEPTVSRVLPIVILSVRPAVLRLTCPIPISADRRSARARV